MSNEVLGTAEIPQSSPGVYNRFEAAEAQLMKEFDAVETPEPEPVVAPEPPVVIPPVVVTECEGDTWEKRYKDLQSRTTGVFQAKADLERLLAETQIKLAEREVPLPATVVEDMALPGEEDLPEVAAMIKAAVAPFVEAKKSDDLDAREKARRKGIYDQIFDAHPDTNEIVRSNDFRLWVEENPRYKPLVDRTVEYDPLSTITMMDLYKNSIKPAIKPVPPPPTDVVVPSVPGVPFIEKPVEDDFSDLGDLATLPKRIIKMSPEEQNRVMGRLDAAVAAGKLRG